MTEESYKREKCGEYLLFLWMEDFLTYAEYRKIEKRINKALKSEGWRSTLDIDSNKV